jgi:hypothetical protein
MFSLDRDRHAIERDSGCFERQRASEAFAAASAPSRSTRYMAFSFGSQAAMRSSAARATSTGDRRLDAYCAATPANRVEIVHAAMDRISQSALHEDKCATPVGFDLLLWASGAALAQEEMFSGTRWTARAGASWRRWCSATTLRRRRCA